jgi:catechol 2,3-dioxygenase-like lactoylglutathione lyase family enzyme
MSASYSASYLPNSLFRETVQICVVTRDLDGLVRNYADRLGIGPWWVKDYEPPLLSGRTYKGSPSGYTMRLALAWTGALNWEIIEPKQGPSIYHDFLAAHGEGIHHVGVLIKDMAMGWDEVYRQFAARGFACVQEGNFAGVQFAYFDTEDAARITVEIIDRPADFVRPEPLYWYPPKA